MQDIFYGALKELNLTNRNDLQQSMQSGSTDIQNMGEQIQKLAIDVTDIKNMLKNMQENKPLSPQTNKN